MIDFSEFDAHALFGNTPLRWLIALGVAVLVFIALLTVRRLVRSYYGRMKATPKAELLEVPLEVLSRTAGFSFVIWSAYAGFQVLTVTPQIAQIATTIITIALFWQAGIWAATAVTAWLERKRRRSMDVDRAMAGSLGIIGFIANVAIWALVLLLTLDNLGVNITALVAGLGIGGIAVALAVQNILGDLFASLSITLDRPFVIGDFLIVDDFLGSVENIGIKSTRLRSLSGEQIVMANADLLGSRVRNYGRMAERRVVFTTNIVSETPLEKIERVPPLIRAAIESHDNTRFDRSHYKQRTLTSVEFETVYYVLSPGYNEYMDVQQAINFRIDRELSELGIEFAYQTQRLLLPSKAHEARATESQQEVQAEGVSRE